MPNSYYVSWFLQRAGGSLINEVYDAVFCLGVNLSGDDYIVATVLWLQQFYDVFERLALHSNSVCMSTCPRTFRFMLFWVNVFVKDSDVNVV